MAELENEKVGRDLLSGRRRNSERMIMTKLLLERSTAPMPLIPVAGQVVRNRMCALVGAIGGLVDPMPGARDPVLAGCLMMPYAGIIVAGTPCRRPLLFPEGEALHSRTGFELILVRHDADRGTTYDIRLQCLSGWLCRYEAWQMDGDLWLVPDAGATPAIRATPWGLEVGEAPPFASAAERALGRKQLGALPPLMRTNPIGGSEEANQEVYFSEARPPMARFADAPDRGRRLVHEPEAL
ncbi:hypothetical protein [Sphingomonas parva]|uniref:hypothetical protein n=1 Tax=Sphingomonas parva TaxID=2555898 RepID=UPI00177F97EE|nr:hypothetical protein [Sphingomonas parva]